MDAISATVDHVAILALGVADLGPVVATAVWAMLPAYFPNNVAVVAGGGPPIDGGRTWRGRRLLGDGKTWRGTAVGIISGVVLAAVLNGLRAPAAAALGVALTSFPVGAILALPVGALAGDILASFAKRRLGRPRGAALPLVDQLDFVAGALVLVAIAAPGWFEAVFTLPVLLTVVVLTPVLHVGTNVLGYLLGLKAEPW